MFSSHFDMKDMGEASFVLGIKILRDRAKEFLGMSQKTYIERILSRFNMSSCNPVKVLINKGDKLSMDKCPKSENEKDQMKSFPYSSVMGSLGYAQVCT